MLSHYVNEAQAKVDRSGVTRLDGEEMAGRRRHDGTALVTERAHRCLLFGIESPGHGTLTAFKDDLEAHHGKADQILDACIDPSSAFINGLSGNDPEAHITNEYLLAGDVLPASIPRMVRVLG